MTKILLSLHVLAAILAVGPVAVAASMFPPALRRIQAASAAEHPAAPASLRTLHRICRVYAGAGIAVPVFGFATASALGVLGDAWLIASILLTAAAAGVLAFAVLPRQEQALAVLRHRDEASVVPQHEDRAADRAVGRAVGRPADQKAGAADGTPHRTSHGTSDRTSHGTSDRTSHGTSDRTSDVPSSRTSDRTAQGTPDGTSGDTPDGPSSGFAVRGRAGVRLAMYTGVFNVLWAAVTILMIVRPGSTTGA
ncbi:hypothetical protein [Sphaerisporangium perillae]|uniref:hypothetical protein n=1 Tax=Sphaerisporangium perillae TaxID=2935860 RepID=UPI00200CBD19|nr:hypothetical protein [Sphaerisporangium perillae]